MNTFDENVSLGELFNLSPEMYDDIDISELPFSNRVTNRLYRQHIQTVGALLKVNSAFLKQLNSFGQKFLNQVYDVLEALSNGVLSSNSVSEYTLQEELSVAQKYRKRIFAGDFSFIESADCSLEEKECLEKYKEAYDVLGKGIVEKCVKGTKQIFSIIRAFNQYCRETEKYIELKRIADVIPAERRENCCKYYITAYTFDDTIRKRLIECYSSENASLYSIIDSVNLEDKASIDVAAKFLDWCSYSISEQISEMFENLYDNERKKTVIEARANRLTLNEIGEQLHVTRERVRQIELKVKRAFIKHQSRLRILAKIYADQNGQSIITQEDIAEVSGNNASALIYLLRITESSFYSYDVQLDAFVFGDIDIGSRIQLFVDSLPDIIRKTELQDVLDLAKEQEDLSPEYVEKAIAESYRITGDIYHRTRLSLASVYEEVLRKYYPFGLHVYDEREILELRNIISNEYGDLGLPENNRAIAARISSIGVLSGRGRYIAKRKQWISKSLENRILNYINDSDSPIVFVGTIFYEFEDELVDEGIDNRYFLQGVLRELVGDRFYFRRDYISKDKKITSIYSSIIAYIKENKYPVKKEEIQAKFQGITDIVFSLATSDSDILNYFGEYLHGCRLVIREDEKSKLNEQMTQMVNDNDAHHIKDLYPFLLRENSEVFSRNAVNGSFRAYSVLEFLFREQFQFTRPYIAKYGVEIERPAERLHEMIFEEEEYSISDISDFARDNHFQISSMIEYLDSLNDKFLMRDINSIASIDTLGVTEEIAKEVERIIVENISDTTPIRNLTCIGLFPTINGNWSEWLLYSCLNKWSNRLDVALSSNHLRQSIPLVSPTGKMEINNFREISFEPVRIKIDDMNDIDNLLSEIITEDMLEDV